IRIILRDGCGRDGNIRKRHRLYGDTLARTATQRGQRGKKDQKDGKFGGISHKKLFIGCMCSYFHCLKKRESHLFFPAFWLSNADRYSVQAVAGASFSATSGSLAAEISSE